MNTLGAVGLVCSGFDAEPVYDEAAVIRVGKWPRRRVVSLTVKRPRHRPVGVDLIYRRGRYVVRSIVNGTDAGLSPADLSGLRLRALAGLARDWSVLASDEDEEGVPCWVTEDLMPYEPPPTTRGPGSTVPVERLRVAASAWNQAKADGGSVQRYVADALHLSIPQAAGYIKRARDHGLIPPVEPKRKA